MGRPSKYTKAVKEKVEFYLKTYNGDAVPTTVGLAEFLDVSDQTLRNWDEEGHEFFGTLERIQRKQHIELLNRGLTGEYNANITKLMLANHGYSDKSEQTVKGELEVTRRVIEFV